MFVSILHVNNIPNYTGCKQENYEADRHTDTILRQYCRLTKTLLYQCNAEFIRQIIIL